MDAKRDQRQCGLTDNSHGVTHRGALGDTFGYILNA